MKIDPEDMVHPQKGLAYSLAKILSQFGVKSNQVEVEGLTNDPTTLNALKYLLVGHINLNDKEMKELEMARKEVGYMKFEINKTEEFPPHD